MRCTITCRAWQAQTLSFPTLKKGLDRVFQTERSIEPHLTINYLCKATNIVTNENFKWHRKSHYLLTHRILTESKYLLTAVMLIVQQNTASCHANNELFVSAAFKRRFECVSSVVREGYLFPLGCVRLVSKTRGTNRPRTWEKAYFTVRLDLATVAWM